MGVAGCFRFMLETMTCKTDMNFETTLISWCVCVCAQIQTWSILKFALFDGHQTMINLPLHHAVRCLTQHAHSLLSMSEFPRVEWGCFFVAVASKHALFRLFWCVYDSFCATHGTF